MSAFNFEQIAVVRSCYKEKFGIPRQPGLSNSAEAIIELTPPYNQEAYVRELEGFSHIWLIFIFHQHLGKQAKPTVRPPRLGGNKRIGVFASRSSFRPNPVGMSVVKLNKVSIEKNKVQLYVSGADLLDGTPVVDIKPYIHYVDMISDATAAYAEDKPEATLEVIFSEDARGSIDRNLEQYPELEQLIIETISLDPRPAYKDDDSRIYGLCLYRFNIKWQVIAGRAEIISI